MRRGAITTATAAQVETPAPAAHIPPQQETKVISLLDRLKQQPKPNAPAPEQVDFSEEVETETGNDPAQAKQAAQQKASAQFEPGYQPGSAEREPEFTGSVMDPENMASAAIGLFDFFRTLGYPWVNERLMFDVQERASLKEAKRVFREAMMANLEPELNNYQKHLLEREKELFEANLKIPFTDSEKKQLAGALAKHIKNIDWMAKLEKYDWVIMLLTIEGVRFYNVQQTAAKARDSFQVAA